ncbi:hypothetical protein MUG94_01170 [Arthrobacter gengyunqii]|uniref:Uncharacterized protein n=1 Tax=Arthrobacter gengyunqii TaxID=2886940 RepID=A0A9X1M4P4_9MICC|nr:hypothetical protein [Arthrobacter gengyunqii]MCC3270872.1 hypothetical protein [Arthrobacter gengyunqii]UOY96437.1 hypothetical protein MUG94_01170 [Arthrobacter gengyunqii]
MKLSDFSGDLESLNEAYNEVTDQLRMEDSEANAAISDVLMIWWEALSPDYDFLPTYEESVLWDRKSIDAHRATVEQLVKALRQRDSRNIEISSVYLLDILQKYVATAAQTARDKAARFEGTQEKSEASAARIDYRKASLLSTRVEQAKLSQYLRIAVKKARITVQEVEAAAASAQTAAGFVSGAQLTKRFEELSKDHLRSACIFRWLTAICVMAGITGTYFLAFVPGVSHGGATTIGDGILRVSLLAAVLGLATYFGKQAGYHRDLGTWARTIKEQLLTFDGYVEPLHDESLRDQMRAAFAARVFGSSPESKEDSGVALTASLMSELLAAAGKSVATTTK